MRRLRIELDLGKIETTVRGEDRLVDEVLALIHDQRGKLNSAAENSHILDRDGRTVGWWWIEDVDGWRVTPRDDRRGDRAGTAGPMTEPEKLVGSLPSVTVRRHGVVSEAVIESRSSETLIVDRWGEPRQPWWWRALYAVTRHLNRFLMEHGR